MRNRNHCTTIQDSSVPWRSTQSARAKCKRSGVRPCSPPRAQAAPWCASQSPAKRSTRLERHGLSSAQGHGQCGAACPTYLERHVLQEVRGSVIGLRLEAGAALDPHAHGRRLARAEFCASRRHSELAAARTEACAGAKQPAAQEARHHARGAIATVGIVRGRAAATAAGRFCRE